MINKQSERDTLTKMSDLEYSKNDVEMMRYRPNALANKFGLAAMACSVVACFLELNSMNAKSFHVIIVILVNIILLLGGFLATEKVKSYNKQGAIAEFVFGGVCLARIFYIPLSILVNYPKFLDYVPNKEDADIKKKYDDAVYWLGATITSKKDGSITANSFLPSSGYFRGIAMIIFLGLAVAFFIAAGVLGYLRARKLSNYLESINQKK